jgi:hypothetical protein
VLALLKRDAATLRHGELAEYLLRPYPHPRRQQLIDEQHRQLACTSATEWLRSTPLHRRLTRHASQ